MTVSEKRGYSAQNVHSSCTIYVQRSNWSEVELQIRDAMIS